MEGAAEVSKYDGRYPEPAYETDGDRIAALEASCARAAADAVQFQDERNAANAELASARKDATLYGRRFEWLFRQTRRFAPDWRVPLSDIDAAIAREQGDET
jgi:hypothetical protein